MYFYLTYKTLNITILH